MYINRVQIDPNWRTRLESIGYGYYEVTNEKYWVEDYHFVISHQEADVIYQATEKAWEMCLQAVEYAINHELWDEFRIPLFMRQHIIDSWNNETPSIYGRFDFGYDQNKQQLKLLEFNADTPTSLFETGIVQWHWKQYYYPSESFDQFNSVHEQLIQSWTEIKPYLKGNVLHFTCARESLEDLSNVEYLRDTAIQAGINTQLIYIDDIGWNGQCFVDLEGIMITDIFKLYPWEWMIHEEFGQNILHDHNKAQWIEPSWKMLLSNKALLPLLWKLFPNNPLLLESYTGSPHHMQHYVKKPLLSREGANIELFYNHEMIYSTDGEYGEEGYVYQELCHLHKEESGFSIIGSWIIGGVPCGINFRESDMPITTDKSRFVPHIISDN